MSCFTGLWYLWPETSLTSRAVPDVLPWFVYCGWSAHKATTFSWFMSSSPCCHCMFNRNVPWTFNRTPVLARPHHIWEFTWPVRACMPKVVGDCLWPCFSHCVPHSLALVCPCRQLFRPNEHAGKVKWEKLLWLAVQLSEYPRETRKEKESSSSLTLCWLFISAMCNFLSDESGVKNLFICNHESLGFPFWKRNTD